MIGATILGCEGLVLSAEERAFFKDVQPFAFILFSRNIESADQIRRLCNDLRATVDHQAPILIDQEGGRVQRLRAPLATEWLPPLDQIQQAGDQAARSMYIRSRIQAHELMELGIDSNCAPLSDVATPETHPFLQNRCYGFTAEDVINISRAVVEGHEDGGVLPVLKHIPGHGRAQLDSHLELPRVAATQQELQQDFAPFKALNDVAMGMTAHLVYEAYDDQPATISDTMMTLIREDIGFDGLIMTDDISMQALSGTMTERSVGSIKAGCDVILHCNGDLSEMKDVTQAAGTLSGKALSRAESALNARKSPVSVDIEALKAELKTLLNG